MNAAVELYEFLGIEPPAPQTTRRDPMTALPLRDFTAAEQDRLAAIEAAPAAEEALRERVAVALVDAIGTQMPKGWTWRPDPVVDAAIAVLSGPGSDAEQAVERVLALADELDNAIGEPDDESEYSSGYASGSWAAADSIRAAVRGES